MPRGSITVGAVLVFLALTILTQIGRLVYVAASTLVGVIGRRTGIRPMTHLAALAASFAVLYAIVSMVVLPPVATALGRPPLPCAARVDVPVQPLTKAFCLFNRHYAKQPVHDLVEQLGGYMSETYPGTVVGVLDANFPFFDGFPLLPHLSHDDGLKIDLAFFYRNGSGQYQRGVAPSPIGYWGFEQPRPGDPQPCAGRSDLATLRWDMAFLKAGLPRLVLDEQRTGSMLRWLAENADLQRIDKILLEPHLATRFNLSPRKVRFQGCRAARHDDHVHVSMKSAAPVVRQQMQEQTN